MKKLTITYFAILRDLSGKSEEMIETKAETFEDLYLELKEKYNFTLAPNRVKAALNDEFIPMDKQVPTEGKVVFIPPVAGG